MKMLTPLSAIRYVVEMKTEEEINVLLRRLARIGEQMVTTAKTLPSPRFPGYPRGRIPPHQPNYIDWTANLRNSIGYGVIKDSSLYLEGGFSGKEGETAGRALLRELASGIPSGRIALIVVAGMNYSQYVSDKGYDVLDSSWLEARQVVPRMLEELGYKMV